MNTDAAITKRGGIVAALFFLSGFSALIYQVVWMRMLSMYVGGSAFSVSIVLTVFMMGLALGSAIAARFVDRITRPSDAMAIYGLIELAVGLYGFFYPLIMAGAQPCYAFLYRRLYESLIGYNAASAVISMLVLIVPTTLMGMTLPLLVRYSLDNASRIGTDIGRLYGVNTIGGALGALVCGFVAIKWMGVAGTQNAAVCINLFVGIMALLVFAARDSACRIFADIGKGNAVSTAFAAPAGRDSIALSIVLAVSGFCAMAYEVLWTKLLALLVGPTTYSFTLVLFTFITGLAMGSIVVGRIADRVRNPFALLAVCQIGAALCAALVSHILGNSQVFFAKLIYEFRDSMALMEIMKGTAIFLFLLPSTIFLGGVFPTANRIVNDGKGVENAGSNAGSLYVVNTVGAVAGSFAAGFVLAPLLGKALSISAVTTFQAGMGILVLVGVMAVRKAKPARGLIVAGLAACCVCMFLPRWDAAALAKGWYQRFSGKEKGLERISYFEALTTGSGSSGDICDEPDLDRIIYKADGIDGFVCVGESVNTVGHTNRFLSISGKIDASTGGDMSTMALSGHIPLLFHKNPRSAMIVGLASGITAGEMLHYPLEELDILEISPEVVKACAFFNTWNNNALSDKRARVIVQDARTHLTLTDRKYDAIMSEPSNPWMAGVAGLFTEDYFIKVRDHLNPGGVFVQWFHTYQMDWDMFSMFGRTVSKVFPHSVVIKTSPVSSDYLVVCAVDEGQDLIDLDAASRNLVFAQKSSNMTLKDPRLLFSLVIAENLGEICGEGPMHTDIRPRLEYLAPHRMYRIAADFSDLVLQKRKISPETMATIFQTMSVTGRLAFADMMAGFNVPPFGWIAREEMNDAEAQEYAEALMKYCRFNPIPAPGGLSEFERDICLEPQEKIIQAHLSGIESSPDKGANAAYLHNALGLFAVARNDFAQAERQFSAAVTIWPKYVGAVRNLAASMEKLGRFEDAVRTLEVNLQYERESPELLARIGMNLLGAKQEDKALGYFEKAVRLNPAYAPALAVIGGIYGTRGELDRCAEYSMRAIKADPGQVRAYQNLAGALAMKGNKKDASRWIEKGLEISPDDPGLLAVKDMLSRN